MGGGAAQRRGNGKPSRQGAITRTLAVPPGLHERLQRMSRIEGVSAHELIIVSSLVAVDSYEKTGAKLPRLESLEAAANAPMAHTDTRVGRDAENATLPRKPGRGMPMRTTPRTRGPQPTNRR